MAKPLEIVKAYIFGIWRILCLCCSKVWISCKKSDSDFTTWYKEHTIKVKELMNTDAPMLNKKQCQHLVIKLLEVVELVQKKVSPSNEVGKYKYILMDLRHIVLKVVALVEECGSKDLCIAAVYQLENEEAFREILLQLECCFKASCLLHGEDPLIDFDIASHVDVKHDGQGFKEILEKHSNNNGNVSDESSNLAKYLLERMQNLHQAKGGELDTLEFPNCKMYYKGKPLGRGAFGCVYESKWLGLTCATKVLETSQGNEPKDSIMNFLWRIMRSVGRFVGLTSSNVVLTSSKGNVDQETTNLFHKEASILAGLNHPNLVKFIGMGKEDGRWPFVMMEKMDKSMSDMIGQRTLQRNHPFCDYIWIDFIQQIASGMYYLHDMHVAHRDLKPDNILWSALRNVHQDQSTSSFLGCVKLTDFGNSKMEVGSETSKADGIGTSIYRAPEVMKQVQNDDNYHRLNYFKADVYSFGITCAEILCGEVKLDHGYKNVNDIHEMIKEGKRPMLQGYSKELVTMIGDCCAFNPSDRPTFAEIWKRIFELKINYLMGVEDDSSNKNKDEKMDVKDIRKSYTWYGTHDKVKEVQRILAKVNTLGIVGMGGIGKSTLANAILEAEKDNPKFNKTCYHHIGEIDNDDKCLEVLQNILKDLGVQVKVEDLSQGKNEIQEVLENNNVFLILDDVWNQRHLNNIISQDNFSLCKNSKLLVCSRNWDVIKDHVEEKYDMQPLEDIDLAMKLFTSHCFDNGRTNLPNQLQHVGIEVVRACKGLPLSLRVLGAYLHDKERLRSWERVLQRLQRGRSPQPGHSEDGLFEVLEISFDGLDEEGKNMFLDICCFFLKDVYGDSVYVKDNFNIPMLTRGESSLMKTFETLHHHSLVDVDGHGRLQMHDQLRDMGRKIVEWKVHRQLCNVDGEIVEKENAKTGFGGTRFHYFDSNVFERMKEKKVNFGRVEGILYRVSRSDVIFIKDLNEEEFPRLCILLIRTGFHTIPFDFTKFKNLTTLDMNGCEHLTTLPNEKMNFSPLKSICLKGCFNLTTLPHGFGNLSSLTSLDLRGCSNLSTLPDGFGNLSSLTSLDLWECSNLSTLPEGFGNLFSLTSLNLSECSNLSTLPDGFGNLSSLTSLDLWECSDLSTLPDGFENLSSLTSLDLSGCSNLSTLPEGFGNLSSLTSLHLTGCSNLSTLPDGFENLSSLTSLDLRRCFNLSTLPDGFGNLSSLTSLDLKGCSNLSTLPDGFGNLSSLTSLHLMGCSNLSTLPSGFENLSSLTSLALSECSNLSTLPDGFENLSSLTLLDLWECSNLSTLPDGFGNLSSLTSLHLTGCSNLSTLPNGFEDLSSLQG